MTATPCPVEVSEGRDITDRANSIQVPLCPVDANSLQTIGAPTRRSFHDD